MSAGAPGMSDLAERVPDVASLQDALDATGYLADEALGTALFLAARMGQPILLEGEPGVGKTEAGKALAEALGTPLLRLQCYEGLTSSEALYHPGPLPAVLLIDEVDRGDDEFEAFLFEMLAEAAVTIPELGTRRAQFPPVVVLTSNRTRDLHDALK